MSTLVIVGVVIWLSVAAWLALPLPAKANGLTAWKLIGVLLLWPVLMPNVLRRAIDQILGDGA